MAKDTRFLFILGVYFIIRVVTLKQPRFTFNISIFGLRTLIFESVPLCLTCKRNLKIWVSVSCFVEFISKLPRAPVREFCKKSLAKGSASGSGSAE